MLQFAVVTGPARVAGTSVSLAMAVWTTVKVTQFCKIVLLVRFMELKLLFYFVSVFSKISSVEKYNLEIQLLIASTAKEEENSYL